MFLFPKKNRESIFIKGKQIKLGSVWDFAITKILTIGDEEYYIFSDFIGDKYLVPTTFYKDYNFLIGQNVSGWIDKINCSGRIFIEPIHPNYNVGETYDFELLRGKFSNEKGDENKIIYVVRDIMGKEWEVKANIKLKLLPSSLKCRVDKIKKGQLYLTAII